MAPRNTRVKAFAELDEQPVKDYDPEGEISQDDGSDNDSQESEDENAGTEHYQAVGTSKLRQKDAPALGAQYRGSRVSRAALQESSDEDEEEGSEEEADGLGDESGSEEFADPDEADLEADRDLDDAEIESDNALTQSDVDRFKDFKFRGSSRPKTTKEKLASRPKASDFLSSEDEGSEDQDDDGAHGMDSEEDEEMENGVDGSEDDEDEEDFDEEDEEDDEEDDEDDEDDDDESEGGANGDGDDQRQELRKIMTEGQKSIVATISQAAKADAEKGLAVRQQRRAFDALLNIRIRLQKALVAANSIDTVEDAAIEHKEPYEAAEEAAIKLLNSIDGFRRSMLPETAKAKIGEKRKREFDTDATSQAIWDSMEQTEALALVHRRKVLDKWSSKVRTTTAMTTSRKLGPTNTQSLVSILDDQLLGSSDRLIKRTRTPRSCAPVQATKKVAEDANIYDDADFYQLLLKELVDQRTMDSASGTTDGAGVTVRWAALKEAKTRKVVDRKASKGRKLRFTVHEKLQNFMAPEDRRSWEQDAIDRFFGTLFGQKMELGEEEESDEEMGGAAVAEDGLRLFRN
ncbi:apoptosis-antagonizing transcription factor [Coniochaeta sp. 2T2.1]|nr:apoptosis-antagonizing transcription factor [Coniochaeta sp. 2T2.1]